MTYVNKFAPYCSPRVETLRQRESSLAALLAQVEAKLQRLTTARRERAAALERIRAEIGRAMLRGSSGEPTHERE